MGNYQTDQDSKNAIDKAQTHYVCCGNNIWLDWSSIPLNSTGAGTTTTAATTASGNGTATTTASGNGTATTTISGNGTATTTVATGNATVISGTTSTVFISATSVGTTTVATVNVSNATLGTGRRVILSEVSSAIASVVGAGTTASASSSSRQRRFRQKRQSSSTYGGINNLPVSFTVVLPQSCCTTDLSTTSNLSNLCKYQYSSLKKLKEKYNNFIYNLRLYFKCQQWFEFYSHQWMFENTWSTCGPAVTCSRCC